MCPDICTYLAVGGSQEGGRDGPRVAGGQRRDGHDVHQRDLGQRLPSTTDDRRGSHQHDGHRGGGAVLGAIADDSTDDHAMPANAQEITIRFDNGAVRVVTQAKTGNIQLNERVKVINSDQHTRVVSF